MPVISAPRSASPRIRNVRTVEVVSTDDNLRQIWARVMQYSVLDSYETSFRPGVFAASLARKLPRVAWGHDWRDPIGKVTDFKDDKKWLDTLITLDDFNDVPTARRAYAQIKSGTIDEFSVGFCAHRWEYDDDADTFEFIEADLDEVSPVLAGAVPGTAVLSVRAQLEVIPAAQAIELLRQLSRKEISVEEAETQLRGGLVLQRTTGLEAEPEGDTADADADVDVDVDTDPEPEAERDALIAEIDSELAEALAHRETF